MKQKSSNDILAAWEDEISALLTKEIQQEIDEEIQWTISVTSKFKYQFKFDDAINHPEIDAWCDENLSHEFVVVRHRYAFVDKDDYLLFILKWKR